MFNTPANVLQAVSDTLQQVGSINLPAQWENIAAQCQTWAYNEIVSALSGRGFTPAQIAAWDRGAEFELDLAIFRALSRGGALANLSAEFIKSFDRRPELREVIYTTAGSIQDPQGSAGLPNVGDNDTSEDIFVLGPSGPENDFPGEGRGHRTRL